LGTESVSGDVTFDMHFEDTCCQTIHILALLLTASWTVLILEHSGESLIEGSRNEELLDKLLIPGEYCPFEPLKKTVN
jgi:hypothetical protein